MSELLCCEGRKVGLANRHLCIQLAQFGTYEQALDSYMFTGSKQVVDTLKLMIKSRERRPHKNRCCSIRNYFALKSSAKRTLLNP